MSHTHRRLSFLDALALEIRADRKTETRRLMYAPDDCSPIFDGEAWTFLRDGVPACHYEPRAYPGDILDVCEALVPYDGWEHPIASVCYRADRALAAYGTHEPWPWKVKILPARYCPEWAVRTHRRIVSVHPERLTDITDSGAVAEGIAALGWEPTREGFIDGFRKLHGLSNDADPWVWVIRWAPGEVTE